MKYLNTEIRPALDTDINQILEIENSCFIDPWKKEDILYEMHSNPYANFWVIELSNEALGLKQVVGFCDFWITFDSATICQIAVHPELQRMHIGSELMDEVIKELIIHRVRTMTLEVRKSNEKAINFYKKYGFTISHVKEKYYINGEDALYMILEVKQNG